MFAFIIFQPSLLKLAGSVNASYALGTRWSSVMLPEFQVDVERRFVNIGLMRSWTDTGPGQSGLVRWFVD